MAVIKGLVNAVADPRLFFLLACAGLFLLLWKREAIAANTVGYGTLGVLGAFFLFGTFDPNFRLIVTKPDNVPIVGLIFLLVFFVWYSIREGGVGSRVGVARPGLHRAHLAHRLLRRPDRVVDLPEGAARAAGESREHAESVEGAVVLPRAAGDARLLRPVARRRRPAGADHRRAHLHSVYRQEPEGERVLHDQRAQGGDRDLPVRVRGALVVAHRARHVPARAELEFLRTLRVLGHPQAGGADQRQPVGVHLGADAQDRLSVGVDRPRAAGDRPRRVLCLRAAGDSREGAVQDVLREARRAALLRR